MANSNFTNDGVRCMMLRGGSSKGAYFLADDLPADPESRDTLLRQVMGSPDVRQIDGIGGAHPLTSKVAIVGPSSSPDADVDYLFLQVGVDTPVVSDQQNCGNLLAGVGPFALERGLLPAPPSSADNEMTVRIRMLNTDSVAVAQFHLQDSHPRYRATEAQGGVAVSGVPGVASPITLTFRNIEGASCGALLPTGQPVDHIDGVACTLIDNGMPVVVMAAADFGLAGDESCADLESNAALTQRLEAIRLQAGPLMNLGDVANTTVPKMTLVSPPRGRGVLTTRTFIPHRCHDAIGVLGAVSVASAALLPDSPAANAASLPENLDPGALGGAGMVQVELEHPTGTFTAVITTETHEPGQLLNVQSAGIVRTARKLMDGLVFP